MVLPGKDFKSMDSVIILNGKFVSSPNKYKQIIGNKYTVAADGGALFLDKLDILPDIIIGDLDSLSDDNIQYFKNKGVDFIKYPVEKDKTDGELALDYCSKNNFNEVTIMGCQGGRIDQQLANIYLLEYSKKISLKSVIKEPGLEIGLINGHLNLVNKENWNLSLISLNEKAEGLSIKGCKYEVEDESLFRYKTLGLSNKITGDNACISIQKGLLLYIVFNKKEE